MGNKAAVDRLDEGFVTRGTKRVAADGQQPPPREGGDDRESLKEWCALHDSNVRPTDS